MTTIYRQMELRQLLSLSDPGQTSAMVLEETEPAVPGSQPRILTIFIGTIEAHHLGRVMLEDRSPRPMTYELVFNAIQTLGGVLQRALITRIERNQDQATFVGALELLTASGDIVHADARPSDAVLISARYRVPIYVAEAVLVSAGVTPQPPGPPTSDSALGEDDPEENP
jgi:bifunctional DNase/RNase